MTKLEIIEKEIASLSPSDVDKLAEWLVEYKAELWDQQIAADAQSGKLHKLLAQSQRELAKGKFKAL